MSKRLLRPTALAMALAAAGVAAAAADLRRDAAACAGWSMQVGPESDPVGLFNTNFPEGSDTTYWGTPLRAPRGSVVVLRGRYPKARHTSFDVYVGDQLLDHLNDVDIVPDPGEENPYATGTSHGTFTVQMVFGPKPAAPPPNTIYTGLQTSVSLLYRIYHSTDPNDPTGAAGLPVLPAVWLNGTRLATCPPRPFLVDPESTAWGRLDNVDWIGQVPAIRFPVTDPPLWSIDDPYSLHAFPNGANFYLKTVLSRAFLAPNGQRNLFVMRFRAPTAPKTRSGEPVNVPRQVRFWSICTDDPLTTNVNRCIPDDEALLDADGRATFVVSDPGAKPSEAALAGHSARWLPWGALALPDDVVYDRRGRAWGRNSGVHYYNKLLYRQTLASPAFTQSLEAISALPNALQQAAMGDYWPVSGYCSTASFEAFGVGCIAVDN